MSFFAKIVKDFRPDEFYEATESPHIFATREVFLSFIILLQINIFTDCMQMLGYTK